MGRSAAVTVPAAPPHSPTAGWPGPRRGLSENLYILAGRHQILSGLAPSESQGPGSVPGSALRVNRLQPQRSSLMPSDSTLAQPAAADRRSRHYSESADSDFLPRTGAPGPGSGPAAAAASPPAGQPLQSATKSPSRSTRDFGSGKNSQISGVHFSVADKWSRLVTHCSHSSITPFKLRAEKVNKFPCSPRGGLAAM